MERQPSKQMEIVVSRGRFDVSVPTELLSGTRQAQTGAHQVRERFLGLLPPGTEQFFLDNVANSTPPTLGNLGESPDLRCVEGYRAPRGHCTGSIEKLAEGGVQRRHIAVAKAPDQDGRAIEVVRPILAVERSTGRSDFAVREQVVVVQVAKKATQNTIAELAGRRRPEIRFDDYAFKGEGFVIERHGVPLVGGASLQPIITPCQGIIPRGPIHRLKSDTPWGRGVRRGYTGLSP